jgi:hypothetical protein
MGTAPASENEISVEVFVWLSRQLHLLRVRHKYPVLAQSHPRAVVVCAKDHAHDHNNRHAG